VFRVAGFLDALLVVSGSEGFTERYKTCEKRYAKLQSLVVSLDNSD